MPRPHPHRLVLSIVVFAAVVATLVAVQRTPVLALGGEGETWPAFTESSGCGAQRIPTPHADDRGWFSRDELLRGDFAAMFGRSVGAVHHELVHWPIPGSSEVLAVHPWMLPALELASVGITDSLARDLQYRIDASTTYSAASRTISGSLRTSRHTYGTAFDINADRNPHRSDNRLITNLPHWWTESFRDAGFCWGGLWIGSKDAMHFAWQGPAFSGYDRLPAPYEPLTEQTPFRIARSFTVIPPEPDGAIGTVLVDSDNNGARDIVRLSIAGNDVVIDASVASWQHNACSSRRSVATGLGSLAGRSVAHGFGDWDGRGGQDLWFATDDDGSVRLTVRAAFGGFARESAATTDVPTPTADAWISTGDGDVDGNLDLFVIEDGVLTIWNVDPLTGATSVQRTVTLPFPATNGQTEYALGDVDLDNRPDLWAVSGGTVANALAVDGYASISETQRPLSLPTDIVDVSVSDYDGDGRPDLVTFDGRRKQVWLGNTPMPDGLPLEVWFAAEDPECDEPLRFGGERNELRFTSSRWVARGVYEWRSANGLVTGCDPEEEACEPGLVTHQDFAEFLAWVDNLHAQGTQTNRSGPLALALAGYELSCPISDAECWSEPMLAAEVSARLGMFLESRSGVDTDLGRWVLPFASPDHSADLPR